MKTDDRSQAILAVLRRGGSLYLWKEHGIKWACLTEGDRLEKVSMRTVRRLEEQGLIEPVMGAQWELVDPQAKADWQDFEQSQR